MKGPRCSSLEPEATQCRGLVDLDRDPVSEASLGRTPG